MRSSRGRLRHGFAAALAPLLVAAPRIASACPVCNGGGEDEGTRAAFLGTTIFLSILPLALVGGAVLWLWRRVLRHQAGPRRPAATTAGRPGEARWLTARS